MRRLVRLRHLPLLCGRSATGRPSPTCRRRAANAHRAGPDAHDARAARASAARDHGRRGRGRGRVRRVDVAAHRCLSRRHERPGDDPDAGAGARGGGRRGARELSHRARHAGAAQGQAGALPLPRRTVASGDRLRGWRGHLLDAPGGVRAPGGGAREPSARLGAGARADFDGFGRDLPVHAGERPARSHGAQESAGLAGGAAPEAAGGGERGQQLRRRGEAVPGAARSRQAAQVRRGAAGGRGGRRARQCQRRRRRHRRGVGAGVPPRRGAAARYTRYRAHRPQASNWIA